MLNIQSSKQFLLALLAFSSIGTSVISPATANVSGDQSRISTQDQSAKFKTSLTQGLPDSLSNGYFTPEQEAKMTVMFRKFNEKINSLQQQYQNSSYTPALDQQARSVLREHFIELLSIMTPAQRELFKKEAIGSKILRELNIN